MTEEYYIGQIFIGDYPPEASFWCDEHNACMEEIEPLREQRRFQIVAIPEVTPEEREEIFLKKFFKVEPYGYYRRVPKGYQSAVDSMNTAFNSCVVAGGLPANTIIFYPEPDFSIAEQCTEEWLVEHQIKLPAMTSEEFGRLYITFVTAWNREEH